MTAAPTPFHVGTIVPDLDAAMEQQRELGVDEWVRSEWKTGSYYDGVQGRVVHARSRVAFGRLSADFAIEFIEPDADSDLPAAWRLDSGRPTAHVGYWTSDPRAAAGDIVTAGGRLLLARADPIELYQERGDGPDWLPAELDTCYLETLGGLILECVPGHVWAERLPALFGDAVTSVIPGPR